MRIVLFAFILFLAACETLHLPQLPFNWQNVLSRLSGDLKTHQVYVGDPVFIRVFKEENTLELWMKAEDDVRYRLIKSYPICNWSGTLGIKRREGDHQSPEGFYDTTRERLNPNSKYHVSFNIGFPNAYDRANGRTGSLIMIHGDCVSEGCYAMTDPQIEEIYTLVERAIDNEQPSVPVHVFPFHMTSERMLAEIHSPHFDFWTNIRDGYDYFERYGVPPKWIVQDKRYEFY